MVREDGCGLEVCSTHYVDCRGVAYGLDGLAASGPGALSLLPLRVYHGVVYVDPDHPVTRSPAPAAPGLVTPCG